MTGPTYKRTSGMVDADVGDELVSLNVDVGTCFGFNEVAACVWRALDTPRSFEQLRDELLARFEVGHEQCTSELRELLDDLAARGLIEETS